MLTHKIIGIDPGKNLGISVIEIDGNFNILNIIPTTFKLDNVLSNDASKGQKLSLPLYDAFNIVSNLINKEKPIAIARETEFVNKRFASSALVLSRVIGSIEVAIKHTNRKQPIFRFSPREIKSGVGAGGNADKHVMLQNLKELPDVKDIVKNLGDELDEHNVDVTAMAYLAVKELKNKPHLLLSCIE